MTESILLSGSDVSYLVLLSHGRLEHERGSKGDGPCEGEVSGAARHVLVDGE